jgi:hypothetical protein
MSFRIKDHGEKTRLSFQLVVVVILYAYLVVRSPLTGDDGINYQIRQTLAAENTSLFDFILQTTKAWMLTQGRFFPGATSYTYTLFYFSNSVVMYKIIIFIVLILAVYLAGKMISMNKSLLQDKLMIIIFLLCFQHRWSSTAGWDGVTAFAALPIFSVLVYLIGIIFFQRSGNKLIEHLSILFIFWALTIYETIIFMLIPLIVYALYLRRYRYILKLLFAVSLYLYIILNLQQNRIDYNWAYIINLDVQKFFPIYFGQILTSVPGGMFISQGPQMILNLTFFNLTLFLAMSALSTNLVIKIFPNYGTKTNRTYKVLFALGMYVILVSPLLTSLIPRWQETLEFGQSYLSITYSFFGVGFVYIGLIMKLVNLINEKHQKSHTLVLYCVIISLNFNSLFSFSALGLIK